jgi:hypothetical protein
LTYLLLASGKARKCTVGTPVSVLSESGFLTLPIKRILEALEQSERKYGIPTRDLLSGEVFH